MVLACGSTDVATPELTSPLASPASPSPSDVNPNATAGEAPAVHDLASGSAALAPGAYTRAAFRPRITFELEEGWFAGELVPGFFDVQQQQGTPDVIAVQFAIVEGIVGDGGAMVPGTTAEAAAAATHGNPGVEVIGESASQLGGLTGFTVEIENNGAAHTGVLGVAAGTLGIDPDRRLWISLFDTHSGVLAVMVGGSVADWDHALAVAEPVLESVQIEDAGS
jgi:hypothetical protein